MFAVDTFIDTVQGAKKYFVNTFITDKEIQKPLNAFVDTQTAFVKQVFQTNKALTDFWQWVKKTFTPYYRSEIEAYLADSTSHADVENRIKLLQRRGMI
jgi:hypothetical protein